MGDNATLKGLRAKLKQLEARKRELDQQVEAIHVTIRVFEQTDSVEDTPDRSTYASVLTNAMYEILDEDGPMHRSELLRRVQERGIYVGGTNPVNALGSYLSKDARFTNVARGEWNTVENVRLEEELDALFRDD